MILIGPPKSTNLGYRIRTFPDGNDLECSIQEASRAPEGDEGGYLWLGITKPKIEVGPPWEAYKLPDNAHVFTRMLLHQALVKELLPLLEYFAENGELPDAQEKEKSSND